MSELPQNIPPKKLSVLATMWVAFGFAWGHRRVLWYWSVIGAILTVLVHTENYYLSAGYDDSSVFSWIKYFSITFIAWMPSTFIFIMLAIYCHRAVLFWDGRKVHPLGFSLTLREGKYFVWILLVYITSLICSIPVSMTVGTLLINLTEIFTDSTGMKGLAEKFLLQGVFLLPFYYIVSRWILVFPAIAIDQHPQLSWSWKRTQGNGCRMFILIGFLPLTVGNLWNLFPYLGLSEFPVFSAILGSFVLFIYMPIQAAVISIAFRELTNWTPSTHLQEST